MNAKTKNGIALSLIPQIILVKILANFPEWIENYYSNGLYPILSGGWRAILGWIPFSVGDVGYTTLGFLAIRYVFVHRGAILKNPKNFLRSLVMIFAASYFLFHLFWGLNYYRQPIAKTLDLQTKTTPEDLKMFVTKLVQKTNEVQFQISGDTAAAITIPYSQKEIFDKTIQGYSQLKKQVPFQGYAKPSIKTSLYSTALTYMGYAGYLNPFTNEAQVNGKLPNFRFSVVSAHEIGHQLGYSAENETNFIGYLATLANKDPYFKYAAYSYALSYCLSDLKQQNEADFEAQYGNLNEGVKKNFREMAAFWQAYENPMEPIFKSMFNNFLKANNQAAGIQSYQLVVSLLVAYHKDHSL